jgi:HPt (histidine-containing phosphotransfer) domain-containing protein
MSALRGSRRLEMVPAYREPGNQTGAIHVAERGGSTRQHPAGLGKRPVDLVHLARQTLGDEALEREVLGLFVSQSEIFLERLRGAKSADTWRMAAHTIKGSARNIGAWGLADAAFAAEQTVPGADDAAVMAEQVAQALGRTNQFIATLLPDA